MMKTSKKSKYNPKNKLKSKTIILKDNTSQNLPPNLLCFKQKLLSGNGFITYKQFFI